MRPTPALPSQFRPPGRAIGAAPLLAAGTALVALLLGTPGAAAPAKMTDAAGARDPSLFVRMPNYFLPYSTSFMEKQYDAHAFTVTTAGKSAKQQVEGHFTQYCYYFDRTLGAPASILQIIRNYQAAARKVGGQVVYEDASTTTIRIGAQDKETWVEVNPYAGGANYYLRIVERQVMQQDVTANAGALQTGLAQDGHVEVPGIFFDTGRADIEPESEPALNEVAKLLQANPGMNVWVVGHTDYVGTAEANVALANARAAAVVKALALQHGVAATRLSPYGVGPYAPVAPNTTDEGRARNRRVELVVRP